MTTDEMLAGYAIAAVTATVICVVTAILRDLIDKWVEKWTDTLKCGGTGEIQRSRNEAN